MALINTTTTGILGTTVFGDGAGTLTVQENGVTINKVTKAPAFKAYRGTSNFTFSSGAWSKVALDTIDFDVTNAFDTVNNRFLPNIAGYYQINFTFQFSTQTTTSGYNYIGLRKNGSFFSYLASARVSSGIVAGDTTLSGANIVYLNGTTDYVDFMVYQDCATTPTGEYGLNRMNASGFLARAV